MARSTRNKIKYSCRNAIDNLEAAQVNLSFMAQHADDRSPVIEDQLPLLMAGLQSVIETTEILYTRL